MRSHDARIVRSAALPTFAAGVIAMLVSFAVTGTKGLIGAALGMVLVVVFFAAGQWALSWCAKHIPDFLMPAALGVYLLQILLVAIATGLLSEVDVFTPKAFGFTALACTLVWMAGQIRAVVKTKQLYVTPDSGTGPAAGSGTSGAAAAQGRETSP